jgi:hypothetical protein
MLYAVASMWLKKLAALELEEKILNGGLCLAIVGIFLPWIGGRPSLIDTTTRMYSGLGFHTGFIGLTVLALLLFTLLITVVPLTSGKTLVRRHLRPTVRLCTTALSTILTLAALSVLLKVTLESPGMEVRFGVYVSLVGCLIAALYGFLAYQEDHRRQTQGMFQYPPPEPKAPAPTPVQPARDRPDVPPGSNVPPPPPPEEHPVPRPTLPYR